MVKGQDEKRNGCNGCKLGSEAENGECFYTALTNGISTATPPREVELNFIFWVIKHGNLRIQLH